jgi:hypothetical protein
MIEFRFNIGEKVSIKSLPGILYNIHEIKRGKYILIDHEGFQKNQVYDEKQLTNPRKKQFFNDIYKTKQTEKLLCENIKNILIDYLNFNPPVRPIKNLFLPQKYTYNTQSIDSQEIQGPILQFYWEEDDWQGTIFAVYTFNHDNNTYYLALKSGFGSCSGCDRWRASRNVLEKKEYIMKEFSNICIYVNKLDILRDYYYTYLHPDCRKKLNIFLHN